MFYPPSLYGKTGGRHQIDAQVSYYQVGQCKERMGVTGPDNTNRLVERACKGDPAAFGRLADEHYRTVYDVAFSAVGNWSGAEDIAQETFLLAWSQKGSLQNASAFPAWLRRIAGNLSKNWIRSSDYRRRLAKHYAAVTRPETDPKST